MIDPEIFAAVIVSALIATIITSAATGAFIQSKRPAREGESADIREAALALAVVILLEWILLPEHQRDPVKFKSQWTRTMGCYLRAGGKKLQEYTRRSPEVINAFKNLRENDFTVH